MTQRAVVTFTDDLDGTEIPEGAEGTGVQFSLDGQSFEIDLGPKNLAKFRKAFQPFADAGRKATAHASRPRGKGGKDSSAIRAWATANGVECNERGRIPASVIEAYENRTPAQNVKAHAAAVKAPAKGKAPAKTTAPRAARGSGAHRKGTSVPAPAESSENT